MAGRRGKLDFTALVDAIQKVHEQCAAHAGRAVDVSLTLRNWAIGCYIREYEQRGADRAKYGTGLLDALSEKLLKTGMKGMAARTLRQCRQFYMIYPQIRQTLSAKSSPGLLADPIWKSLSAKSTGKGSMAVEETVPPESMMPADRLLQVLSFSHFAEFIAIDDPFKRAFYEIECVRGNWSVRELKRQIGSLYFERSGLSRNKEKLAAMVQSGAGAAEPRLAIRDPYVFEFLGLLSSDVMGESDLEDALLDKLHDFLLELGHGFCFEARQKRILIGDTHAFIDLVFYHRILKCHVLVELKVAKFSHEHLGQLNTYVSWYKRNMMTAGDNPPVGILLCTQKDRTVVEYALADMDNRLFVSKYQVELPSRKEIQRFMEAQLKEVGDGK